jgi:hypothetical protein
MKKLTIIPAVLMVCVGAYAQGSGTISIQNDTTTTVTSTAGNVGPAAGYKLELFYQPDSGGAAPVAIGASGALGNWTPTQYGVFGFTPANLPAGGVFDPGIATLAGITAGNNVWLELVGWNNSSATLSAALATPGELTGFSKVWANGTGNVVVGANPPSAPDGIIGTPAQFTGMAIGTPEPSTWALGILGASSLLAFRRKK